MKIPPAPVSNKAFVSTILSLCSWVDSEIGIEMDLLSICATRTLEIVIEGGTDVEAGLLFKNPE